MKTNPGRGGKGGRGSGRRQYISNIIDKNKEKKQKLEVTDNQTWEEIDKDYHDEPLSSIQNNLKSILKEPNEDTEYSKINSYLNNRNDESIGTIDDEIIKTIATWNNEFNNSIGQIYTVQVSIKILKEKEGDDDDLIFEEIAGSSAKFIIAWMKKQLITGVVHNTTNEIIDDICAFNQ